MPMVQCKFVKSHFHYKFENTIPKIIEDFLVLWLIALEKWQKLDFASKNW